MDATVLDLRYRMADVLNALDRREEVRVLYHGKPKGRIIPEGVSELKVIDHPFFGSRKSVSKSVDQVMDQLRGGRFRDL
jgi:antitoxin (DNA-binding transcriptional repressor) of toxin-antitoxin stability system